MLTVTAEVYDFIDMANLEPTRVDAVARLIDLLRLEERVDVGVNARAAEVLGRTSWSSFAACSQI